MNSKGFTLIEILITMVIMVIVVALTIPLYTSTVDGISALSSSEDAKLDNLLAMEMIRLDMKHVGTGIGLNEAASPITYSDATQILDLHSTLVNTNQATFGWGLINCTVGSAITTATDFITDQREDTTNTNLVLLDSDRNYIANTNGANYNCATAVEAGQPIGTSVLYTAFPTAYTSVATPNACTTGFCTNVRYTLSAAQPLETCAPGTLNLTRAVGGAAGTTLVNCVADFRVRFDLDANTDGRIDPNDAAEVSLATPPALAADIMAQVKNIDMYLLVQVGKEDRSLRSAPNLTVDGINFSLAGITNPTNYRWKILKINGKPNTWL